MLTLPLILAAVSAGLFGGFHCVGMCGGMSHLLSGLVRSRQAPNVVHLRQLKFKAAPIHFIRQNSLASGLGSSAGFRVHESSFRRLVAGNEANFYLHAGRLSTYALIGALFGGVGGVGMGWSVGMPVHQIWYALGNVVLISLGLRLLGLRLPSVLSALLTAQWRASTRWTLPSATRAAQHPFVVGMGWGVLPCGLSFAVAPLALLSGAAWSGAVLMLVFGLAALPHLLIAQALSQRLKTMRYMRLLQAGMALILIGFGVAGLWLAESLKLPVLLCL